MQVLGKACNEYTLLVQFHQAMLTRHTGVSRSLWLLTDSLLKYKEHFWVQRQWPALRSKHFSREKKIQNPKTQHKPKPNETNKQHKNPNTHTSPPQKTPNLNITSWQMRKFPYSCGTSNPAPSTYELSHCCLASSLQHGQNSYYTLHCRVTQTKWAWRSKSQLHTHIQI